ncbi:response regulator transcription factor [Paenibacillus daejeonensis]|uniref:response regulator transcription factor n=1 Tax=Paenibacillus daejeonensis TaxID=135193 RepID=UPI00036425E7|nr:response regulator transcription factor [Paenibacillus daejeonensis]
MYRVIIVDDEPFIIEGLYYIIDWSALGLEIVGHAPNGQAALELLSERGADILVTDISMPVMGGLELIDKARQLYPELKIVVLSGYNEFDYLKQAMRAGIENYLLKPVNVEELRATMAGTVEKLRAGTTERWSDEDMDILRNTIVYRWLTGAIAPGELRERAATLDLPIASPYYLAAMIRREQAGETDYEQVKREVSGSAALVLPNLTGEIVILYVSETAEDLKAMALAQLKPLLTELGSPAHLALGTIAEGARAVHVSYTHAVAAVDYAMVKPLGGVLDYEALKRKESSGEHQEALDWDSYARLIPLRDKEQLASHISDDFTRMLEQPGITPATMRNVAVELIVRFKTELQALRSMEEPELYQEELLLAASSTSVATLIRAVQEVAAQTVDALVKAVRSPVIDQVLARVAADYREPLSLKSLGKEYKIHPVYLGQLFHKEMKESFTEYLNKYRIDTAKMLLRSSNSKVQEIAQEVGYWETGYFYKQFKKYVGVSPMDYRELT